MTRPCSPPTSRRSPSWNPKHRVEHEVQLRPARVLMQDFTGVPAVCDLAAMRDAFVTLGKPGKRSIRFAPSTS